MTNFESSSAYMSRENLELLSIFLEIVISVVTLLKLFPPIIKYVGVKLKNLKENTFEQVN